MAGKETFSTQDLRSAAAEQQRDTDQKHKWAYGQAYGPGRLPQDTAHARPRRPNTNEPTGIRRDGVAAATFKARSRERRQADIQDYYESGDSSAPEEIEEVSAAPEPDAQITYSYDAAHGPNHGSQVLSAALAQAVERFEVAATEKLIKDEYEVLDSEGEPIKRKSKTNAKASALSTSQDTTDEDGFEVIDRFSA